MSLTFKQYNITLNCKLNKYRIHLNRLHPNIGLFQSIFCTCSSCNWQRCAPVRSLRQLRDRTGFISLCAVHLPFDRRYRRYIHEHVAEGMSGARSQHGHQLTGCAAVGDGVQTGAGETTFLSVVYRRRPPLWSSG